MTVAKKIVALAASTLMLSTVLGVVSLVSLATIRTRIGTLAEDSLPGLEAIGMISAKAYRYRGDAWKHLASNDANQLAAIEQEMSNLKRELEEQLSKYEKAITQAEDRDNFARLKQHVAQYCRAWQVVSVISRQNHNEAYSAYLAQVDPAFTALRNTLLRMQEWNKEYGIATSSEAVCTATLAAWWTWLVMLGALVLGIGVSVTIIRGLNRSLRQFANDLLQGAFQVARAAKQVASSSDSLAQGSSEQAAALQETAACSEEIRTMAERNTQHTSAAHDLVVQSGHEFVTTNDLLNGMVHSMTRIGTASDKISKIIKIIDEIAFQTNILALNAAVEAARAGEAGMGFAVVADEVRSLAHRSARAAKDTSDLIAESIASSHQGNDLVGQVATAVRATTEQARQVQTFVAEVKASSQEQTTGVQEVDRAVAQMQTVTQRTAANAQESAAAATELLAQSEKLKETVAGLSILVGSDLTPEALLE